MLGIGLLGYTYVLEQAGIRFLGIGGTSAGSINALLLAALGTPEQEKGGKLLDLLANKNFMDFIDGDSDARDLLKSWLNGAGKFKLAFKAAQVIDSLQGNLGLNPGDAFTTWLKDILRKEGIESNGQLQERMRKLPSGLRNRAGEPLNSPDQAGIRLAMIAADVTTETKVEFPRMASLYWSDPNAENPASFARASMSIPYFFEPFKVSNLPQGDAAKRLWEEQAGYYVENEQALPQTAMFIDGGIMSNFPINLFHDESKVPDAPTFGVKLEFDKRLKTIDGPIDLLGAIFNSARHTLDYDFICRNADYKHLLTWIPAKDFNWLDFKMSDANKLSSSWKGPAKRPTFFAGSIGHLIKSCGVS